MTKLTTAKHPSITWVYGPLQYAPGEGMTTTIGVFRVEVKLDSDETNRAYLFIPQADIDGMPIAKDLRGLPSGDPVDFEQFLDRCVRFLKRRLESALETIGETCGQNQ
jgi:hypothetical protein